MFLYTIWRERRHMVVCRYTRWYCWVLHYPIHTTQIFSVVFIHTYTNCVASIPSITTKKPFYIYQYGQTPMMHTIQSSKSLPEQKQQHHWELSTTSNSAAHSFASKQLIAQFHDHQAISFSYIQRTHINTARREPVCPYINVYNGSYRFHCSTNIHLSTVLRSQPPKPNGSARFSQYIIIFYLLCYRYCRFVAREHPRSDSEQVQAPIHSCHFRVGAFFLFGNSCLNRFENVN